MAPGSVEQEAARGGRTARGPGRARTRRRPETSTDRSVERQLTHPPFRRVRRRDGSLVPFDPSRIIHAIFRALREAGRPNLALAEEATARVLRDLARRFTGPLSIEHIQDTVEAALMSMDLKDAARAYVTFRRRRADIRDGKRLLGVRDELKLSVYAAVVLRERYLRRDERGRLRESTGEMMDRVAHLVAQAEETWGSAARWEEEFARSLRALEFLPNSPTLMNAGTDLGLLSGCFVCCPSRRMGRAPRWRWRPSTRVDAWGPAATCDQGSGPGQ